MDKSAEMKKIIAAVGRDRAIELVMAAYNTEMLTTLLNRLEEKKPMTGNVRRNQLEDAITRVLEVCALSN
jgi:CO dehydrogenase/acetyl-CoA synthase gamma subunit (corrinoid Fe-S protein)